jgi:hypothetical protein
MSAKPARRIAYAAKIPNAMDPIDAQTNIVKFNRSPSLIRPSRDSRRSFPPEGGFPARRGNRLVVSLSQKAAFSADDPRTLTLVSVAK